MHKPLLHIIAKVATNLDANGNGVLAARLDSLLKVLAEDEWEDSKYNELSLDEEEEGIQTAPEDESEIKLLEHVGANPHFYEDLLLRHNIIPIKMQGSSLLGKGIQGIVLRALWNGRQVAVKISNRHSQEMENWAQLKEAREGLSDSAKKHIPEVYEVGKDELSQRSYVVMELLEQPPTYILEALYYHGIEFQPLINVKSIVRDEGVLYNAVVKAAHAHGVSQKIASDIFKKLLGFTFPEESKDPNLWRKALAYLRLGVIKATHSVMEEAGIETIPAGFSSDIVEYLTYLIRPEMPDEAQKYLAYPDKYSGAEDSPEVSSFLQALLELADAGLYWGDLHEGNVMMRPSTKELVLVDLGFFTTEEPGLDFE